MTTSPGMSISLIEPPRMEGLWPRRGHVGSGRRNIVYTKKIATLQAEPHSRMALQYVLLKRALSELAGGT